MSALTITVMVLAASAVVLMLQVEFWRACLVGKTHYRESRKWLLGGAGCLLMFAALHLGIAWLDGEWVSLARIAGSIGVTILMTLLCLSGHYIAARLRGFHAKSDA